MLKKMTPLQRLTLVRRGLLVVTPFAIIGALYVAGKNQILGLVVIGAFFLIALRFSKIQEKVEAQAATASEPDAGGRTA